MSQPITELNDYLCQVAPLPFSHKVPDFPVRRSAASDPFGGEISERELKERPEELIPRFLPAMHREWLEEENTRKAEELTTVEKPNESVGCSEKSEENTGKEEQEKTAEILKSAETETQSLRSAPGLLSKKRRFTLTSSDEMPDFSTEDAFSLGLVKLVEKPVEKLNLLYPTCTFPTPTVSTDAVVDRDSRPVKNPSVEIRSEASTTAGIDGTYFISDPTSSAPLLESSSAIETKENQRLFHDDSIDFVGEVVVEPVETSREFDQSQGPLGKNSNETTTPQTQEIASVENNMEVKNVKKPKKKKEKNLTGGLKAIKDKHRKHRHAKKTKELHKKLLFSAVKKVSSPVKPPADLRSFSVVKVSENANAAAESSMISLESTDSVAAKETSPPLPNLKFHWKLSEKLSERKAEKLRKKREKRLRKEARRAERKRKLVEMEPSEMVAPKVPKLTLSFGSSSLSGQTSIHVGHTSTTTNANAPMPAKIAVVEGSLSKDRTAEPEPSTPLNQPLRLKIPKLTISSKGKGLSSKSPPPVTPSPTRSATPTPPSDRATFAATTEAPPRSDTPPAPRTPSFDSPPISKASLPPIQTEAACADVVEALGVDHDEQQQEQASEDGDWTCPVCQVEWADDGDPMVGCDKCRRWFHWHCVGMIEAPPDNVAWFCNTCGQNNNKSKKLSLSMALSGGKATKKAKKSSKSGKKSKKR